MFDIFYYKKFISSILQNHRSCCVPYEARLLSYWRSWCDIIFFHSLKIPLNVRSGSIISRDEDPKSFIITEHTRVCSLHFKEDDFRDVTKFAQRRYLKHSAVPTQFNCWENVPQREKRMWERLKKVDKQIEIVNYHSRSEIEIQNVRK